MKKYLLQWLVYTVLTLFFLSPFCPSKLNVHQFMGISILIGFFAGLGNAILGELSSINEKLK